MTTHMHALPTKARRGHQIPETGVTDSCLASWRCWELNPGPWEEQSALLTSESSLQPIPQLLKLWVKKKWTAIRGFWMPNSHKWTKNQGVLILRCFWQCWPMCMVAAGFTAALVLTTCTCTGMHVSHHTAPTNTASNTSGQSSDFCMLGIAVF